MTDPTTAIDTTRLRELLRTASSFRSQSMRTAALGVLRKEAANAIPVLLDQLAAQAAEIERVREERSTLEHELTATALAHCQRADKADARVAELKVLLREIRDSYHDNRAGGWPGAGDVFADAICRIDAALSKREGGR